MSTPKFISIQGSYTQLEISLFNGSTCLQTINEINRKASSLLIPFISELLKNNDLSVSDLDFICLDQGPGAFTSLRVTIATANGISFAKKIPLVGIDGLDALSQETLNSFSENSNPEILVSLLNAYNNDVYFAINKIVNKTTLEEAKEIENSKGYKKINLLLSELKDKFPGKNILFSGNGTLLHKDLIQKTFGKKAIIPHDLILVCSAKQIAEIALEQRKEKSEFKLYPLYLKSQSFTARQMRS